LPEFVQTPKSTGYGYGSSITGAGLFMLPGPIAILVVGTCAAPLVRWMGPRLVVFIGSVLIALPFALLALPVHDQVLVYASQGLFGIGYGLAFPTISAVIVAAVRSDQTGVANGMNANIRTIGGAIGAAIVSSIVTASLRSDGFPRSDSYVAAWILLAVVAGIAAALALFIPKIDTNNDPQLIEERELEAANAAAAAAGGPLVERTA
jgi:MFS family permease